MCSSQEADEGRAVPTEAPVRLRQLQLAAVSHPLLSDDAAELEGGGKSTIDLFNEH